MKRVGRVFQRGSVWWLAFYHRGHEIRQSSHCKSEAQARRLLKRRLGEVTGGRFVADEKRITFDDLIKDLRNDYQVNGKRSMKTVEYYLPHMKKFFGMERAMDITPGIVRAYQIHRIEEGASNATINREVAIMGRMLSLALNAGKLSRRPKFTMLAENNVRQGFLDHGDFVSLLRKLPNHLTPLVEFLYMSGWRKGEALKLEWRDVDISGKVVRLRIENSKNKEARILPLTGTLWEIIQNQSRLRRLDCPAVFHHNGRKLGDYRKEGLPHARKVAWKEPWFTT